MEASNAHGLGANLREYSISEPNSFSGLKLLWILAGSIPFPWYAVVYYSPILDS